MFGIGFTELLLIATIAILFLGPDKLPGALVDMAKFIKNMKRTIGEAKSSLEEEMKIADLKEEALNYKKQLNDATAELKGFKNTTLDDLSEVIYEEQGSADFPVGQDNASTNAVKNDAEALESKNETVTFKKKNKTPKKKKNNDKGTA